MSIYSFFNRDISWLSFNERLLTEAGNEDVPLGERIKFLSIYSSNLDEFYRVRIPVMMALQRINKSKIHKQAEYSSLLLQTTAIVHRQQESFGKTIASIIPLLENYHTQLVYNTPIPDAIRPDLSTHFFTQVLAFLKPVYLSTLTPDFFPGNNKLYTAVLLEYPDQETDCAIVNIPSDYLPRFKTCEHNGIQYVVFIDDVIKLHLPQVFRHAKVTGWYSFKITRDAELNLEDEYEEDMAAKIERQLMKRDLGFATRFLYQPGFPSWCLEILIDVLGLSHASIVEGGAYHNLKDLASFPFGQHIPGYKQWPPLASALVTQNDSIFDAIARKDIVVHAPYQSYNTILRFFNEAAVDPTVSEIYVTMYRIASDSRIAHALISAARNGKQVSVLVELKARFDEANNIRWAKQMKAAGIQIIYSDSNLKVHAKIALVKRATESGTLRAGLLATGNLNENTAKFYTDHILLTAHHGMLHEMEQLFVYLRMRKKAADAHIRFHHLLVAPFNLQDRFFQLINREIEHAGQGLPASIIIKLNNLEEKKLISKLYEASCAGVSIQLIIRGICCLIPGIPDMSDRITVRRIVDRYLEHGRVFIFNNNGNNEIFMGSADWMDRNIYRRVEVCFPVYDEQVKAEISAIIDLQLRDTEQAVLLDSKLQNQPFPERQEGSRSQQAIYELLKSDNKVPGAASGTDELSPLI